MKSSLIDNQRIAHNFGDINSAEADRDSAHILKQIHSDICHCIPTPTQEMLEGDAWVTDQKGIKIGVKTADCTPVLFYGEKGNGEPVVGAAHAGWRGAIGGVLQNTVQKMLEQGTIVENIRAAIGPCITQRSYEVDEAFYKKFIQQADENEGFFIPKADKYHFDLAGYCASTLAKAGVKQIDILDIDTYTSSSHQSYRRETHQNLGRQGNQFSWIKIDH